MASVNIGEANQGDAFYRYKMPKLQARIQGRGNGIKTEVVNNVDIAKALERPPDYIVKFYGCELGAQTNFDKKTGTSIVNGAHDAKKLMELLEAFIKKYVQCYDCGNPETVVKIKRENINLACKACGAVSEVDMRHRLNTYILKNPPEEKISKAEKKLRKQEKERLKEAAGENLDKEEKKKKKKDKDGKKSKKSKSTDGGGSPSPDEHDSEGGGGDEDAGDVEWMTDTSAAAAQRRAQEQLTSAMAGMVTQGNLEAEAEAERRREEKRTADEAAAAAAVKAEEDAAAKAKEEAERKAAVEAAKSPAERVRDTLHSRGPAAAAELLNDMKVENGAAERMSYLLEAIFGAAEPNKLAAAITSNKPVLQAMGTDPASQMALLIALEHNLAVTEPSHKSQVMHVLKALYDEDIIEEDIIAAWHARPGTGKALGVPQVAAEQIRKASAPFVEWLAEASSDEESE